MNYDKSAYDDAKIVKKINNGDYIDWEAVCTSMTLSESFMDRFQYSLDWEAVCKYQELSESFMDRHADKLDWENASIYQEMSESFLDRHFDVVDWQAVSRHQELSEEWIANNDDLVDWNNIARYQSLSEWFILNNIGRLDSQNLLANPTLENEAKLRLLAVISRIDYIRSDKYDVMDGFTMDDSEMNFVESIRDNLDGPACTSTQASYNKATLMATVTLLRSNPSAQDKAVELIDRYAPLAPLQPSGHYALNLLQTAKHQLSDIYKTSKSIIR